MQIDSEVVHIGLMIGQYVLLPFGWWAAKKFREGIVSELKTHVDETMNGR